MRNSQRNVLSAVMLLVTTALLLGVTPVRVQAQDLSAIQKRAMELMIGGKHAEALAEAKKLEAATKARFGTSHASYVTALFTLAKVYGGQRNYDLAIWHYQMAIAIGARALGDVHPDVLLVYEHLADLYHEQGQHVQVIPLCEHALAPAVKAHGWKSGEVMGIVYQLGKAYERELPVLEKALGREHPYVILTLQKLADLYRVELSDEKAAPLYKRAFQMHEKTFGSEHPEVVKMRGVMMSLFATPLQPIDPLRPR